MMTKLTVAIAKAHQPVAMGHCGAMILCSGMCKRTRRVRHRQGLALVGGQPDEADGTVFLRYDRASVKVLGGAHLVPFLLHLVPDVAPVLEGVVEDEGDPASALSGHPVSRQCIRRRPRAFSLSVWGVCDGQSRAKPAGGDGF